MDIMGLNPKVLGKLTYKISFPTFTCSCGEEVLDTPLNREQSIIHEHITMNKTYIANEIHPYLKTGVEVNEEGVVIDWMGMKVAKPINQIDWYDEVRWKPEVEEEYYFVKLKGIAGVDKWLNKTSDNIRYDVGNCYKTLEQAQQARERVLRAYKGE